MGRPARSVTALYDIRMRSRPSQEPTMLRPLTDLCGAQQPLADVL